MSKRKSIYFLIVDDDSEFATSFIQFAYRKYPYFKGIHLTNHEDMLKFLENNYKKISAIILDVIGYLTPDQGAQNESFVTTALTSLIENSDYNPIPRAIFTADQGEFDHMKRYFIHENIFFKENDKHNLLEFLIDKANKLENNKIRNKYKDVFDIFEKEYLDAETEEELLTLINSMNSGDAPQIKSSLGSIRRIHEKILQTLHKASKDVIPYGCIDSRDNINFWNAHYHLNGKDQIDNPPKEKYYDGVVEQFSRLIYKIGSDYGAHNPPTPPENPPTKYTVQSMVYALFDFLKWFGKTMEEINDGAE